ncbi:MAG: DnaA ATPase domain-containing protein [Nitrospinales bacterium]
MPEKKRRAHQLLLEFPAQPRYSFSNFIVSEGSEFAVTAAKQICISAPFNTLFISGDKGLGKTHLLMSIGNHVGENFPDKKALYVDCDDFVRGIEKGRANEVERTVDQILQADYFLLDNIDRISNHRSSQEKLYSIYNALTDREKVIVFAGPQTPDKLSAVQDYLTSRFQWGIIVQLNPIDDHTTAKIIKKLNNDLGLEIPDGIISFLLSRIPRDFQSIHNAVSLINQESYIQKKKVTRSLVREALELL